MRAVFMYGDIGATIGSVCAQSAEWLLAHSLHCGGNLMGEILHDETGEIARNEIRNEDALRMGDAVGNWAQGDIPVMLVHYDDLWDDPETLVLIEQTLALPGGSLSANWPSRQPRASKPTAVGSAYDAVREIVREIAGVAI